MDRELILTESAVTTPVGQFCPGPESVCMLLRAFCSGHT